jgi:hypothetical protein
VGPRLLVGRAPRSDELISASCGDGIARTTDSDVLKEEVMTVRPVLLLVLVCGAGFTGSIVRSADAAAFTCPDTVTSDAPRNTSPLSDLYSGATDLTAGNRLGELMADLRKTEAPRPV